jgi:hypothetical protein
MRELVRRAAEEFADRLCEIFRAELMEEIRRELARAAPADEASPDTRTPIRRDKDVAVPAHVPRPAATERIFAFVAANPGVAPARRRRRS